MAGQLSDEPSGFAGQREPRRLFVALCSPLECHLALLLQLFPVSLLVRDDAMLAQ